MNLKDFNYKRFFFDYGEKIGLAVAGAVALILGVVLVVTLLTTPTASSRAADLKTKADGVSSALQSNQPDKGDKPEKDAKEGLVAFAFGIIPNARIESDFQVPGLYDGRRGGPGGRQMPTVLPPQDSGVALVHFQLPGLVYSSDGALLMTLKGVATTAAGPGMNPNPGGTSGSSPKMPNMGGFASGSQFQHSFGNRIKNHGILRDPNNPDPDKAERDYDIVWKKPEDVKESESKLATQPIPERAAMIVASFPYKDQIDKFKDQLGLPSEDAVLSEVTTLEEKNQTLHTFRFRGVEVERRQVNSQGRPIDGQGAVVTTPDGGWGEPLDLQDAYAGNIVLSGGVSKLQPETLFQKVAVSGLTLPKLPTVGEKRTPPVDEYPKAVDDHGKPLLDAEGKPLTDHDGKPLPFEMSLASLKKTVDALNTTPTSNIAKPGFTQRPDDIFSIPPAAGTPSGPGGTGGPMGLPNGPMPPGGRQPGGTTGPMGTDNGLTGGAGQGVIPDYVLIRLFDFTIEPGQTYEYRIRVRMANPNYGRRNDVASQGIAADKELNEKPADKDWYLLPKKLRVSSDLYYYAVDQAKLDAQDPKVQEKEKERAKDKDAPPRLPVLPFKADTQTVLQIQKWVDFLPAKNRTELAIGDWVIAERVVATRGEPIARQRVEVPYWRKQQDRFTMAADQTPRAGDKHYVATVEVPFVPDGQEPILVDFTGGDVSYARTHPKTEDAAAPAPEPAIADRTPEEVLLYTADGKLLAHHGAKDATDPERIKRLDDIRKWIDEVKKAKSGGKEDKLFGGTPGT